MHPHFEADPTWLGLTIRLLGYYMHGLLGYCMHEESIASRVQVCLHVSTVEMIVKPHKSTPQLQ